MAIKKLLKPCLGFLRFYQRGIKMDLEKLKEKVDSTEVVEELIILSSKVFGKSNDDVKKVVEMFITKSYLMGKKNMVKTIDD
jgi:hypothetical protein